MSMYAINQTAIDQAKPAAFPPRPYLRVVAPPGPSPRRRSRRQSRAVFRRRRLAVLLVAMATVLAAWAPTGAPHAGLDTLPAKSFAPAAGADANPQRSYVVKPGDTLWVIARRLQPGSDVRPIVDRLAAQRRGEPLQVGERIALP